jgi:acyl carrier protein
MRHQEILNRVKKVLLQEFKISEGDVRPWNRFKEDLNIDSLGYIWILIAIEEEFDIEIPEDVAEKFLTIENVVEYLYAR